MTVKQIVSILNAAGFKAFNKFMNVTTPKTANVVYDTTKIRVSSNTDYRLRHRVRIVYYLDDPDDAIQSIASMIQLIEPQLSDLNPIFEDPIVVNDGNVYVIELPYTYEEVIDID